MLGSSLARAVGGAPGGAALSTYLQRAEAEGRLPLSRGKCDPAGDASLGYVIAHVLPHEEGVTVVDVTSTARVHFWRSRASATALRSTLAVMHHAEKWREHSNPTPTPTPTHTPTPTPTPTPNLQRGFVDAQASPPHTGRTTRRHAC